jgi:hypothetical protein
MFISITGEHSIDKTDDGVLQRLRGCKSLAQQA